MTNLLAKKYSGLNCIAQLLLRSQHVFSFQYCGYAHDIKLNITDGPVGALKKKIAKKELMSDEHQLKVIQSLQKIYEEVHDYKPDHFNVLGKWFGWKRQEPPKGLYLYGAVGGGKTMLMDLFYECCQIENKRRVHFHSFMLDVHKKVHEVKKTIVRDTNSTKLQPFDPIPPVAAAFIQVLKDHCLVETLDSGVDYRLKAGSMFVMVLF